MKQISARIALAVIVLLSAGAINVSFPAANGASPSDMEQVTSSEALTDLASKDYPKLESALSQLVVASKVTGAKHALALAPQMGVDILGQDSIRVIVESDPAAVADSVAMADVAVKGKRQGLVMSDFVSPPAGLPPFGVFPPGRLQPVSGNRQAGCRQPRTSAPYSG